MKSTLFLASGILVVLACTVLLIQTHPARATTTTKHAIFAGGCFWCMEKPFEKLTGVIAVTSGYTGGRSSRPTYESYGTEGHIEAVKISYDPQLISYATLLDVFWRQIDPTDPDGQFVDRGHPYTTAIFYLDDEQRQLAEVSKKVLDGQRIFNKPIVTPILPAVPFYPAEEYHQDYYKKNPIRYRLYRSVSGRDRFLKKVCPKKPALQKPNQEELRQRLTPLQFSVTQKDDTEPPFQNEYWDNKRAGIYVDVVSGEPLFGSLDKFVSNTGWTSFTKPLRPDNIVEREDRGLFSSRTEVRSRHGDSHLGHVFSDGPPPTGLRYCINSAAMRFIPAADLAREGLGEFVGLFQAAEDVSPDEK